MKHYAWILLLFAGYTSLSAQNYTMKVEKKNGEAVETRADDVKEVLFNNGSIRIKGKNGTQTDYEKGAIRRIRFVLDENGQRKTAFSLPHSIKSPMAAQLQLTLTNLETKQTYRTTAERIEDKKIVAEANIPNGRYSIAALGTIDFEKRIWNELQKKWNVLEMTAQVKADKEVDFSGDNISDAVEIPLKTYTDADGFLITEVFFASPPSREYDDQYIKIGNNTDSVKYADGLAIVESRFNTNDSTVNNPQFKDEMMTITWAYVIPGTGRDVPVQPGEELVIALNADNYKTKYGTFDLSHADFEFYDNTRMDTQNEDVPDLENWTNVHGGQTTLSTRGCKALGLVKIGVDRKKFKDDFYYTYSEKDIPSGYINPYVGGHIVPNAWAVDVVEIAASADRQWNVFDWELDCGFTYATTHHVGDDYGKAVVRRKVRGKWRDTNNSTKDFRHEATSTMY